MKGETTSFSFPITYLPGKKMKACVCIDYLSHEWSSTDLIQAHRELQRQKSKTQFNIITKQHTGTLKELKKLSIERNKQIRYQNAIWRQMARSCTKRLSHSNQMIHPSTVNWYVAHFALRQVIYLHSSFRQKESDVTCECPEYSSITLPKVTYGINFIFSPVSRVIWTTVHAT